MNSSYFTSQNVHMKRFRFLMFIPFILFSCAGEEEDRGIEDEKDSSDDELVIDTDTDIIIDISLNKVTEFPSDCVIEGTMIDVHSWNDRNGTNYFIRSLGDYSVRDIPDYGEPVGTQYLYAYHYVEDPSGAIRLLRETIDFEKDCEFDLVIGHELDALTLTDIDEDEVGEIAFIYRLHCTSDVSSSTQKLIMIEDGAKYPLRGSTEVMGYGGEFEAGDEFENAPEGFLEHATNLWSEHLTEYDFDL